MMSPSSSINVGDQIGSWTILERLLGGHGRCAEYRCRCVCGNESVVQRSNLRRHYSRSCGKGECSPRYRHGEAERGERTRLYNVFRGMRDRSKRDGLAAAWSEFEAFRDWALANGFQPGKRMERIDRRGPFTPTNLRFV